MYGLLKHFLQVVNARGEAITSGLGVIIRTTAGAVATVYSNEFKAAFTNPVTVAAFDALATGIVEWWSASTSFDIEIYDVYGKRLYIRDWTPDKNCIVFDVNRDESALLVGANVSAGAELVDTAATFVDFPNSVTIPAGTLVAGDVIKIRGQVRCADFNSGDTLDVKLLVGTESIFTTGDLTIAANGDLVTFDVDVTVDVAGSSGYVSACGFYLTKLNATVALQPIYKASTAEDLSGDIVIKVQGDYSAEHADNEAYLQHLNVVLLKRKQTA